MAHIEDVDGVIGDREQNAVLTPLVPSVKQFADFLLEIVAFRGERPAAGKGFEGVDRPDQPVEPFRGDMRRRRMPRSAVGSMMMR